MEKHGSTLHHVMPNFPWDVKVSHLSTLVFRILREHLNSINEIKKTIFKIFLRLAV